MSGIVKGKNCCRFFAKGQCTKGHNCPYPHLVDYTGKPICPHHANGNKCTYGKECHHSHDLDDPVPQSEYVTPDKLADAVPQSEYDNQVYGPEQALADMEDGYDWSEEDKYDMECAMSDLTGAGVYL